MPPVQRAAEVAEVPGAQRMVVFAVAHLRSRAISGTGLSGTDLSGNGRSGSGTKWDHSAWLCSRSQTCAAVAAPMGGLISRFAELQFGLELHCGVFFGSASD